MNIKSICKGLLLLGGFLLAMPVAASAQQGAETAPLVLAPAQVMTWKMSILSPAQPADPSPEAAARELNRLASVTICKNREASKVILVKKNGLTVQLWRVGNNTLSWIKSRNRVSASQDNPEMPPYPYASAGFYGIEHVKPADEQKPMNFEQTPCRYFRGASSSAARKGDNAQGSCAAQYEAWFDLKTGLPRAYRDADTTLVYQFATTPEEVQMPPEYQAAMKEHLNNLVHAGLLSRPQQAKIQAAIDPR